MIKNCPYCQASIDVAHFKQHADSLGCRIEIEINSDPILRYNLREATLDYRNLLHQIDIQIFSFKLALHRALNKQK